MNDFDERGGLSAEARELLDETRAAEGPTGRDRARVKKALMATLAGGAGLAASSAASSAAASAMSATAMTAATGSAGLALGLKIAAVVVIVGAIGGAVAVAPWRRTDPVAREPAPAVTAAGTAASSAASSAASTAAPMDHDALAPPVREPRIGEHVGEAPSVDAEPPAVAEPSVGAASVAPAESSIALRAHPRAPSRATSPAPSTLAQELALLGRAQRAINGGEPESALALLAEHARRFPNGAMAEEREAARVVALCRAGQSDRARAAASRFLRERPNSPLAARVGAACD